MTHPIWCNILLWPIVTWRLEVQALSLLELACHEKDDRLVGKSSGQYCGLLVVAVLAAAAVAAVHL